MSLTSLNLNIAELKFIIEKGFSLDFSKFLREEEYLEPSQQEELRRIIQEKRQGKPWEYILKKTIFFGLDLYIDERVFIPRPETEVLVEEVLKYTKPKEGLVILDIGTGSANISISIALNKASFKIFSVEISKDALRIAKKNVLKYRLKNVFLINSDLLSCFKENSFDIIISNPPYVESSYIEANENLKVEPREALDGGEDGLILIRGIIDKAKNYLKKQGLLFLEIGYNQSKEVLRYALKQSWESVSLVKDYLGIERVVILRR